MYARDLVSDSGPGDLTRSDLQLALMNPGLNGRRARPLEVLSIWTGLHACMHTERLPDRPYCLMQLDRFKLDPRLAPAVENGVDLHGDVLSHPDLFLCHHGAMAAATGTAMRTAILCVEPYHSLALSWPVSRPACAEHAGLDAQHDNENDHFDTSREAPVEGADAGMYPPEARPDRPGHTGDAEARSVLARSNRRISL